MKGRFITIEGQDGAGKSSNLGYIREYLESRRLDVRLTREPGGTALGEQLRKILLYGNDIACCGMAELLLMFAARAQHLDEVLLPALDRGTWVVSDRFTDATYAYQGAGRELGAESVRVLEQLVQKDFRPDLTILLDIPPATARARGADSRNDRFERERDAFRHRVRSYYLSAQQAEPQRIKLVDASASLKHVRAQIEKHLERLIHETAGHE